MSQEYKNGKEIMNELKNNRVLLYLSGSSLRKLLIGSNKILNKIKILEIKEKINRNSELPQSIIEEIEYFKVKFIYQMGRDSHGNVEKLNRVGKIEERIDDSMESPKSYYKFHRFLEELIAYHKFLGGRD